MNTATDTIATSRAALWTGRVLSGMAILFFVMDISLKLLRFPQVAESLVQLGWPAESGFSLGVLLLLCALLYVIPKTAVLGAVLMTGYLGGAIATHARLGDPLFSHTLFGVYVGVVMWLGLWLRDARLRALMPWRR